jgi:hypothetical protein
MASYTITTTTQQDRAIAWLVARINENNPEAQLTVEEFVQAKAGAALADAETRFTQQALELLPKRFAEATNATKAQILTLLGIGV